MRSIMITGDEDLIAIKEQFLLTENDCVEVYRESTDPLDVMSAVCESGPSLIIVDDDFLAPQTVHIMKSIRKVNHNIAIIFCTSNTSIKLGKEVSQLGIQYYAIKPLDKGELRDSFQAILQVHQKKLI